MLSIISKIVWQHERQLQCYIQGKMNSYVYCYQYMNTKCHFISKTLTALNNSELDSALECIRYAFIVTHYEQIT